MAILTLLANVNTHVFIAMSVDLFLVTSAASMMRRRAILFFSLCILQFCSRS